ncbi:MAG: DUF881 domain-containing protein [Clostridia bacterium]|nr:DUF881 domain-containing protein [Clostridia bacterium]
MNIKDKSAILLFIFLILGILLSVQFRSIKKTNSQKPSAVNMIGELQKQLDEEKKRGAILNDRIKEYETRNDEYLKAAVDNRNDQYLKNKLIELEQTKLKAGLTDVVGHGIIVTMDDASKRLNDNPNINIIHYGDILKVLNELKKSGAQAISINGERIIATSEQICAGPTIRINKNRYPAPFVIKAIGNPDKMYDALYKSDTVAYMLRDKIRVDIKKEKEIMIAKYSPIHDNRVDRIMTELEVGDK